MFRKNGGLLQSFFFFSEVVTTFAQEEVVAICFLPFYVSVVRWIALESSRKSSA